MSRTFHGRDIFAPVAAHLAAGVTPARFGKRIEDYLRLNIEKPQRTGKRSWTGTVMKIDRFGNLVTNLHIDEFPNLTTRPFELNAGLEKLTRLALTFSEGNPGELLVLVGSSGYLEVTANQASAAKALGVGRDRRWNWSFIEDADIDSTQIPSLGRSGAGVGVDEVRASGTANGAFRMVIMVVNLLLGLDRQLLINWLHS